MTETRKVVLITGGSRGIGAATALRFAENGYDVVVNYLTDQSSAQQVCEKAKRFGVKAVAIQGNVADESQVINLFEIFDQHFKQLNVLVNNAGILDLQTTISGLTAERVNRILQTNVTGTIICAREAIARMSTASGFDGGSIINVSSMASKFGSPNEYIDYAASKGAVDSFTVGLAKEVADFGIRVNGVRPGLIHTDMHAQGGEPGRVDRLKSQLLIKRGGTPEEVAGAIAWLASEQAGYVTGSFIDIGGRC